VALKIDKGANKIGLLSLVEEKKDISSSIHYYGSLSIDESITTYISLGMGESNHLNRLEEYGDEEELHKETGLKDDETHYPLLVNGEFVN